MGWVLAQRFLALVQSNTTMPYWFATVTLRKPVLLQVCSTVEFQRLHVGFQVGRQVVLPAVHGVRGETGGGTGGLGPHIVLLTTPQAAGVRHMTL